MLIPGTTLTPRVEYAWNWDPALDRLGFPYSLAIDAITHPGPADPARVPASACTTPFMPGVDPVAFPADYARMAAFIARTIASSPRRSSEPPLACYVKANCAGP